MACIHNTSVSGVAQADKRMEIYTGVTDGSGVFSIVYTTPFINPVVLPVMDMSDSETLFTVSTNDTTGFSIKTVRRGLLTVLSINLLSFAVINAPNIALQVVVMEK